VSTVVWDAEGDVDDGFKLNGDAAFHGGAELPLAKGVFGVGVQLRINAADELNTVNGTIGANDGVKNDFTFHILLDEFGRVLGIDLSERGKTFQI
jgi:hypothetical protein